MAKRVMHASLKHSCYSLNVAEGGKHLYKEENLVHPQLKSTSAAEGFECMSVRF